MDEVVHLHVKTHFRKHFWDHDIGILEGIVGLVPNIWELVGLIGSLGLVVFANHVDDDISIGNHFSHAVDITRRVIDKSRTTQIKGRPEVTQFELIAAVGNVGTNAVGACK